MQFDYNTLKKAAEDAGVQTSFDPLPENTYDVFVDAAVAGDSKKGHPQIKVTFKVEDGEFKNRLVWLYLTFTPESATATAIAFRNLATLGIGEDLLAMNNLELVAGALVGKQATIKVAQRPSGDKVYNDVKDVKARGGVPTPPPEAEAPASNGGVPF